MSMKLKCYFTHTHCAFCILFQNISTSLCFRGQRIFLHNANGRFGSVPLEASGDFGIHPEEGEFHLMCQVLLPLQLSRSHPLMMAIIFHWQFQNSPVICRHTSFISEHNFLKGSTILENLHFVACS
jgi:hypothetical protein